MLMTKLAPNRHEVNQIKALVDRAIASGKKPSAQGIAKVMNMHLKSVTNWVNHFTKDEKAVAPKVSAKTAKPGPAPKE